KLMALENGLEIMRVPTVEPLATTNNDEDYPVTATAKDGTIYMAYLSFTRGKDFQGARERPSTPESGPNSGPLAVGAVRNNKNLDYGNWELFARSFDQDGKNASQPVNISNAPGADFMPAATTDSDGKTWVTWVGARETNFKVFVSHQTEPYKFSVPQRISDA